MRKIIFFTAILCFSAGCSNKKSEFEIELINNNWLYYPGNNIDFETTSFAWYLKFDDDNTFENFDIASDTEFPHFEEIPVQNWSYDDDEKLLNVGGHVLSITEINGDTIRLRNDSLKSKLILLKLTDKLRTRILEDTLCKGS